MEKSNIQTCAIHYGNAPIDYMNVAEIELLGGNKPSVFVQVQGYPGGEKSFIHRR